MPTSDGGLVDAVLDGSVSSGVYPLHDPVSTDELVERAGAQGWVALAADAANGKVTVLEGLAAAGRFPAWFGRNWDALSDCLVDLSWLPPAEGYLVLIDGWGRLTAEAPADAATLRAVLAHASAEWSDRGTPFVALTR